MAESNLLLAGTIEKVLPTQQVSDSFKKRDLIINTGGDYPQLISVQFVQDAVHDLDMLVDGMQIEVSANVRGRAWVNPQGETKYFNSLQGWKFTVIGELEKPTLENGITPKMNGDMAEQFNESQSNGNDDLPF